VPVALVTPVPGVELEDGDAVGVGVEIGPIGGVGDGDDPPPPPHAANAAARIPEARMN
jgi:hypothetical protein